LVELKVLLAERRVPQAAIRVKNLAGRVSDPDGRVGDRFHGLVCPATVSSYSNSSTILE
jgi:hypothetical protein